MKKKVLALILATILMLSITTGCSKVIEAKEEDKTSITSQEVEKEETSYPETVIIKDVEGEFQFDFDEAMKNIYIAGKKISMPTTLAELGEGFSFNSEYPYPYIDGDITCEELLYNGEKVAVIRFEKGIGKKYDKNSKILSLLLTTVGPSKLYNMQGIYKFRVAFPMTEKERLEFRTSDVEEQKNMFVDRKIAREEILTYFGRPTEVINTRHIYRKNNSENTYIQFILNEEDGLYDIFILVEDENTN